MAVTIKEASEIRAEYVKSLFEHFAEKGEDVGMITSGSFNFPVTFDGKEAFVEIVVKVPKSEDDECYAKREEYQLNLKEKERKAIESAEKKAKKMEADAKRRAEAKAKREKLAAENASVKG